MVAAMTESEPDAVGERAYTASSVDRDSAPRWARRLAVQLDVGCAFTWFSSREASPAFNNPWHLACYGWRVGVQLLCIGWRVGFSFSSQKMADTLLQVKFLAYQLKKRC
jgi:hypothetical protein